MKYLVTFLLAAAMAGVCAIWAKKLAVERAQTAALRVEAEEKAGQIERLEAERQRSKEQKSELAREADELAAQLRSQTAATTNLAAALAATNAAVAANAGNESAPASFGKALAKMMQDPDMKKVIRDQQRAMMDSLYGPLVKQLGLSPEGADKFKDMMADAALKASDKVGSLFGGQSSANPSELAASAAADQKSAEEAMKGFLGDAGYAQYKDYQQTVSERMQLTTFKQQLAGTDSPLSDQQTDQLLGFMKEEKQNLAANTGQTPTAGAQGQANPLGMLSDDQIQKLLDSQAALNQRVQERAQTVLSPGQMEAFGKFQESQLQMMRMGMTMARKMFSPEQTPSGP